MKHDIKTQFSQKVLIVELNFVKIDSNKSWSALPINEHYF